MNKQLAAKIIIKVKEQIAERTAWCTATFAKDIMGQSVSPESKYACQWCIMGAVRKIRSEEDVVFVTTDVYDYLALNIPDDLLKQGYKYLDTINDSLGFETIHHVLDNAIKNLEK